MEAINIPNKEYLELNFVAPTATGTGNNMQFIMENQGDGTFLCIDGRVGIKVGKNKPKQYVLPMSQWDEVYTNKVNRGYLLTKQKKMERKEVLKENVSSKGYGPIKDTAVQLIVDRLLAFANQVLDTNYTVKIDDISDEMVEYGKKILDELADFKKMSVAEFNNKLRVLYAAIPRRMDKLSKFLAKSESDFNDIVANEQELYDIMIGQIRSTNDISKSNKTILEAMGIDIRPVTEEEKDRIIKKLGSEGNRYKNAWRIINYKTEKDFEEFCKKENLTEKKGIDHLFHGSRNENFWSIITNGLTVNPTGVVITGKAYGNGTYFAPQAVKSMGYTSRSGSRWANGTTSSGFLGIYKVATGKRFNGQGGCNHTLNWKNLQKICPGAHCTWAEARYSGFCMDEVIVYQNQQSTVEYLVEVGL